MGAAFLARDVVLGRPVVVKVMLSHVARDPLLLERFRREAIAGALIDSESVVKVYETALVAGSPPVPIQGLPFIAMQFVDGATVFEVATGVGRVGPDLVAAMMLGIAKGLVATHAAGIVHRDVKASNALLTRDGKVKLADFGLAKFVRGIGGGPPPPNVTMPGVAVGSPAYIAPEQARGDEIDGRADIYALGVSFYELVTGTLPFVGKDAVEVVTLRFKIDPRPPRELVPDLSPELESVCLAFLERDPSARPNASEAVGLLERLVPGDRREDLAALFFDPEARGRFELNSTIAARYGLAGKAPEKAPRKVHGSVGLPAEKTTREAVSAPAPAPAGGPRLLPAVLYAFGSCVLGASAIAVALILRPAPALPVAPPPVVASSPALTGETAPAALRAAIASRKPERVRAVADALRAAPAFAGSAALLEAAEQAEPLVTIFAERTRALDGSLSLERVLDALARDATKDGKNADPDLAAAATLLGTVAGLKVPRALLLPGGSGGPSAERLDHVLAALRLERPEPR
jgi:serine/threonine-protein kinase